MDINDILSGINELPPDQSLFLCSNLISSQAIKVGATINNFNSFNDSMVAIETELANQKNTGEYYSGLYFNLQNNFNIMQSDLQQLSGAMVTLKNTIDYQSSMIASLNAVSSGDKNKIKSLQSGLDSAKNLIVGIGSQINYWYNNNKI